LTVAADYPNTTGGARALLLAGTTLFEQGKYSQAQAEYEKFLQKHPDYQLANEAAVGLAASLEAQGKTPEAISRYEEIAKRHGAESSQAKVSLARLYLTQNKTDTALKLYDDVIKDGRQSSWGYEAELERETLLTQHPELKKQPAPPQIAPTASLPAPQAMPAKP
jgi:tetratricopeptide (TPR) repeat protein